MKYSNMLLPMLIGVLSIAYTYATRVMPIGKETVKDNYICLAGVDFSSVTFSPVGGPQTTISAGQPCPTNKLYCVTNGYIATVLPTNVNCTGNNSVICCIRILRNDGFCTNPMYPHRLEIYCKPQ